jgi:ATP-dependent RNA helicase DDX23/PRP28
MTKKKFASSAPKKVPLSIEEILKKKREADEAASKVRTPFQNTVSASCLRHISSYDVSILTCSLQPKFLSKAERERLALEKRQKEVEAQKVARENAASGPITSTLEKAASSHLPPRRENGNSGGRNSVPTGPRSMRNGSGEVPTGPASMRPQGGRGRDMAPPPAKSAASGSKTGDKRSQPEDKETELIRQRYMGAEQAESKFSAKKKRRRTTEKKFNFEWNVEEDTSVDHNPIYTSQLEANFYGRGHLGGMDADSKKYAKAIEARDPSAGSTRAQEMLDMDRQRKESSRRTALDKHWSEKALKDMRERDWRIFKEDFNISTKGGAIPNPMRTWQESGLPSKILNIVHQVGYDEPSAVQRAAIPIALQNRDLIGIAVTGSGKTAAFLLPLLVYISQMDPLDESNRLVSPFSRRSLIDPNQDYRQDGPYAIILAPTRELAQQIELEAKKFATPLGFKCVSIVGGHAIEEQAYQLRDGAEIIIATPGRLVDCIERRVLVLGQCCYIIMDEADRMIDLGFEEPVNKILEALPVQNEKPDTDAAEDPMTMQAYIGGKLRYRQTMMYTATMPSAVERIARKYLRRPAIVTIGNVGEAVESVEQRVEFISGEDKRKKRLQEILGSNEFKPPIIIFVNIKRNCDAVARDVKHMGFSSVTLHGSKTQDQREAALAALRNGSVNILVATDLAGRGIDVPDVSLVINFNMALSIEQYTHRIGRTGRAGKNGISITFLGNEDTDIMYDLKVMLQKSPLSKVPEELRKHEAAQQKSTRGQQKKVEDSSGFGGKGGSW